jgi:hypothetical protein
MATHLREKIKGEWVRVTPTMATEWLNANTGNRKLREGIVEKYARDMKHGDWTRNPQPIMFYEDGELADGQHRLWAVIESKTSVEFFVQRGVPRDVALNIDTGFGRDLVDNAHISKYDGYITKQGIGTAIFMHRGKRIPDKVLSNAERLVLLEKYAKHVEFADSFTPQKKIVSSIPIRAAVARAHMHLGDNARLVEFCTILGTGIPNDAVADRAVLAFRNYMLEIAVDRKTDPRDIFLKAMNAISYFMKSKPLMNVRVLKDEAYPLKEK